MIYLIAFYLLANPLQFLHSLGNVGVLSFRMHFMMLIYSIYKIIISTFLFQYGKFNDKFKTNLILFKVI